VKKVSSSEKWYIGIVIGVGLLAILVLIFQASDDTLSGEAYRQGNTLRRTIPPFSRVNVQNTELPGSFDGILRGGSCAERSYTVTRSDSAGGFQTRLVMPVSRTFGVCFPGTECFLNPYRPAFYFDLCLEPGSKSINQFCEFDRECRSGKCGPNTGLVQTPVGSFPFTVCS